MTNKLSKILPTDSNILIKDTFLVIQCVFAKFIKIYILRLKLCHASIRSTFGTTCTKQYTNDKS